MRKIKAGFDKKGTKKPPEGAHGSLTHVPGADEDGDHVRLVLVGMFVLHQLQQLAESFPLLLHRHLLLKDGGQGSR